MASPHHTSTLFIAVSSTNANTSVNKHSNNHSITDSNTGYDNNGKPDSARPSTSGGSGSSGYKRASRKGAPRRFQCEHPGCDKIYSRAEHLQRHQLNHNPREIYRCDVTDCDQKFVRLDLLSRHRRRHTATYTSRNRVPSFEIGHDTRVRSPPRRNSIANSTPNSSSASASVNSSGNGNSIGNGNVSQPTFHPTPPTSSGPHDAAILLTPESNSAVTPSSLNPYAQPQSHSHPSSHSHTLSSLPSTLSSPTQHQNSHRLQQQQQQQQEQEQHHQNNHHHHSLPSRQPQGSTWSSSRQRPSLYDNADPAVTIPPESSAMVSFSDVPYPAEDNALVQGNFATWLFNPQTAYNDFSVASLPFFEAGLESTFNNNIHYDYESLTSLSPLDHSSRHSEASDDWISESRRHELLQWFHIFRKKQSSFEAKMPNLVLESGGDVPALSLDMLRDCLREFWETISPRLPIIHQHTFSPNRCPVFLLLVMLALGASSLRSRDTSGRLAEYGPFADLIISCARWEILTSDDSTPPASLWVAQALLLLEFYEKLYTSRKLHERAHIYHPAYLTLLRRGSPLIGKTGSESPPESSDGLGVAQPSIVLDSRMWWTRWAETESMHRVVFAAFMLDIIHAAMFGHTADMTAHEIRLPLPCDDNLWTASSPDIVRQLDANLRMYGVKQVSFLDGLKSALHGKEVMTHSFGRMIIVSGLLSVGWHLSHRENHLKWLDLMPSLETQDGWRKMLLRAFDSWKDSFDVAMSDYISDGGKGGGAGGGGGSSGSVSNGPINSAAVLYHLAHMSLHTDIVDCQVYAGVKRLLGRKVSSRDYANAVKRMTTWAKLASTRHAILHAFRVLGHVLVDGHPNQPLSHSDSYVGVVRYSIRREADPHRPWIMYYAVLAIWAFVRALGRPDAAGQQSFQRPSHSAISYPRTAEYVSGVAQLTVLDENAASLLYQGLPELLDLVTEDILEEADTELMVEARDRLRICKNMLLEGPAI